MAQPQHAKYSLSWFHPLNQQLKLARGLAPRTSAARWRGSGWRSLRRARGRTRRRRAGAAIHGGRRPAGTGPEGPIVRNCTVRPRISDLDSSQDCLCLAVLRAWLAAAGFIACNHGMQMELPGLLAAVLPHWTQ